MKVFIMFSVNQNNRLQTGNHYGTMIKAAEFLSFLWLLQQNLGQLCECKLLISVQNLYDVIYSCWKITKIPWWVRFWHTLYVEMVGMWRSQLKSASVRCGFYRSKSVRCGCRFVGARSKYNLILKLIFFFNFLNIFNFLSFTLEQISTKDYDI